MAQDVALWGAVYTDVPEVRVPQSGGGTASFFDVSDTTATASDVAQGKLFHASDGTLTTGTASGGGGIVIPQGFAYYNGYLLPEIPEHDSGYDYAWIRKNDQNDVYDLVLGNGAWYTKSGTATLDNWALIFANLTTRGSRQYTIPQDGSATDWGTPVTSTSSYYGTNTDRKVIWSNHDIRIASLSGNVLLKRGYALTAGGVS